MKGSRVDASLHEVRDKQPQEMSSECPVQPMKQGLKAIPYPWAKEGYGRPELVLTCHFFPRAFPLSQRGRFTLHEKEQDCTKDGLLALHRPHD
jgi:hypothetical protein